MWCLPPFVMATEFASVRLPDFALSSGILCDSDKPARNAAN
jgi:hypothetical protein